MVFALILIPGTLFGEFLPDPGPGCTEHGPHYGNWTCQTNGSIFIPGELTWTNDFFCLGGNIEPPEVLWTIIEPGKVQRDVTFNCQAGYSETATNFYTPSFYFSPALPTTATAVGTNTYVVYVEGISQHDCCTNLGPVVVGTVTVNCLDSDVDDDDLPDCWELHFFRHLLWGPDDDPDDDGLPNSGEYAGGYNPTVSDDSDGDHLPDFIDYEPQVYDTTLPAFVITSPEEDEVF